MTPRTKTALDDFTLDYMIQSMADNVLATIAGMYFPQYGRYNSSPEDRLEDVQKVEEPTIRTFKEKLLDYQFGTSYYSSTARLVFDRALDWNFAFAFFLRYVANKARQENLNMVERLENEIEKNRAEAGITTIGVPD